MRPARIAVTAEHRYVWNGAPRNVGAGLPRLGGRGVSDRVRRIAVLVVALATMLSPGVVASAAPTVPSEALTAVTGGKSASVHLVLLADDPLAVADGTAPAPGQRLDATTAAAEAHTALLRRRQNRVLDRAGIPEAARLYHYTTVLNGFAARLTPAEAARLNADPRVIAVIPDQMRRPVTDSTPGYLELDSPQGAWSTGYTGEGVVIGVVDTGIWPEHPSFDPAGYRGRPSGFTASGCDFGATGFRRRRPAVRVWRQGRHRPLVRFRPPRGRRHRPRRR